nr:uncharacterized protein LOC112778723 [Arachis hypogaea]
MRRNIIWRLVGRDNEIVSKPEDIAKVADDYFCDIFTSSCAADPNPYLEDLECKVTASMNRRLQRPVTMDEVKRATFSVHAQSAPGDDGFTAKFFHFFWDIVGGDVFKAVRSFFHSGRILKSFNHTQICLIPKVPDASDMTQLGFDAKWINWTKELVTTVSYSVIVEGQSFGYFRPNRGIRQGDLLSPYLFLFCAEGLSFLLYKAEQNRLIQGVQVNRRCQTVNHLLFADDSILFCKSAPKTSKSILELLETYEDFSGQKVNLNKSAIFFSHNTPQNTRLAVAQILNIEHIGAQDKYLGLPSIVQKSKKATFGAIKDKVQKRIMGWKRSLLSSGGRHTLLRAVGEAIPIYTLSCFKLPDTLLTEIHSMLSQFWWGQKGAERRMVWIKWDTMTRPKKDGGLGIKDLRAQNLALLGKQCWRLMKYPNSTISRMLKAKYFRYTDFLYAEIGSVPSWGWRSILEGRKVIEKGLLWKIGSGTNVHIFHDPWLPPPVPLNVPQNALTIPPNLQVYYKSVNIQVPSSSSLLPPSSSFFYCCVPPSSLLPPLSSSVTTLFPPSFLPLPPPLSPLFATHPDLSPTTTTVVAPSPCSSHITMMVVIVDVDSAGDNGVTAEDKFDMLI